MCFSVTPTSLIAGRTTTLTICCDHHNARPRGAWIFKDDEGFIISEGLYPSRSIVPPGSRAPAGSGDPILIPGDRDSIANGWEIPPDLPEPNPSGLCISLRLVAPYTATQLWLNGRCINVLGTVLCTELKILPVYIDTAPGTDTQPPNAGIPEPFRRKEAPEGVIDSPLNFI